MSTLYQKSEHYIYGYERGYRAGIRNGMIIGALFIITVGFVLRMFF